MVLLTTYYLIIGLIVAFILEHIIRWTGNDVTFWERIWMISLWPIMTIVFVYNFVKGFF